MQRTVRLAQDEAVIATAEILALGTAETDFADAEEIFEEAGATFSKKP